MISKFNDKGWEIKVRITYPSCSEEYNLSTTCIIASWDDGRVYRPHLDMKDKGRSLDNTRICTALADRSVHSRHSKLAF